MAPTASSDRNPGKASFVRRSCIAACVLFVAVAGVARVSEAQADVPTLRGVWGLKSGTQFGPGTYLGSIYYYYFSNKLIDKDGVPTDRNIRRQLALPVVLYVSPTPIFGTYWGAFAAGGLERAVGSGGIHANWGLSDTYVQPIYLGWKFPSADATAGFAFIAPTAKFKVDAKNNNGLGMWSYAFDGGTTVYLDSAKRWSVASLATFNTNSSIRGSNRKAGNLLMLEGGAGHSILKTGVVGLAYYAQWKVSDDKNIPLTLDPRFDARHRYYALGP
jgi:hypothetical protein